MPTTMTFLTNSGASEIGEVLNTLTDAHRIVVRKPQATDYYTQDQLLEKGTVGLFRLNEGVSYDFNKEHAYKCYCDDQRNLANLPDAE